MFPLWFSLAYNSDQMFGCVSLFDPNGTLFGVDILEYKDHQDKRMVVLGTGFLKMADVCVMISSGWVLARYKPCGDFFIRDFGVSLREAVYLNELYVFKSLRRLLEELSDRVFNHICVPPKRSTVFR